MCSSAVEHVLWEMLFLLFFHNFVSVTNAFRHSLPLQRGHVSDTIAESVT